MNNKGSEATDAKEDKKNPKNGLLFRFTYSVNTNKQESLAADFLS